MVRLQIYVAKGGTPIQTSPMMKNLNVQNLTSLHIIILYNLVLRLVKSP